MILSDSGPSNTPFPISHTPSHCDKEILKMGKAKRVILRLLEDDMDYLNPREFVDFYCEEFPSDAASNSTRHFIRYQPPNDVSQPNARVHILIDLETRDFAGTLNHEFPHEIYAVRRGADQP
ncbi:hypothetical protein ANOM_006586 [Aspergillus nomiae NRRL 13137]|uniref:Uncharacterized protein n=1 Tax=Aspergillus nomiae NRRL (strain ATCC 15546 / NRRL 13137 / CBS 260.88 / M93) TaxID=1509407 RepID=A0A0L1J348_ASPN3|nr:uncharacterized protein ANOM_006586 [Aspergillus nomiae NRRL 13137]KNG86162.1 hypothetical protein ANOM_006586 [Aspergillus nomiae NRRL 13137]